MFKKIAFSIAVAAGTALATVPASAQVGINIRLGPPPAPRYEAIPVAPGPGYAWRAGYWVPAGGRYVWHRGYYARPPYRGAHWVRDRWVRGSGGWHRTEGYWRR